MDLSIALAVVLFLQTGSHDSQVVIARPEVSNDNVVHVGQTLVIPLYDGEIAPHGYRDAEGLRLVGQVRIPKRDLLRDLGKQSFGGYDAVSERGAAFIVGSPGGGSINVLLRLPQYKDRCVSCRTVHFYYRAE